jgi:hypothetical protein
MSDEDLFYFKFLTLRVAGIVTGGFLKYKEAAFLLPLSFKL